MTRRVFLALLTVVVLVAAMIAFTTWYVKTEKTVYYWDSAGFWLPVIVLTDELRTDKSEALSHVIHSIQHEEYNMLYTPPLALVGLVFGNSRLVYELSILILYLIPASFTITVVADMITRRMWPFKISVVWRITLTWVLVVTNPFLIAAVLKGYPDVVGLVPIWIALVVYAKKRASLSWRWLVAIGTLFVLATLLRRWYIFAAVSTIMAIGIDQIYLLALRTIQQTGVKRWLRALRRLGVLLLLPLTYIGLFVAVAWPYIQRLFSTDYATSYAAYKNHSSYFDLLGMTINHFGVLLVIIALSGLVLGWVYRARRYMIFIIVTSCAIAFVAVGSIQSFDTHQYYLLITPLFVGLALAPVMLTKLIVEKAPKHYNAKLILITIFAAVVSLQLLTWLEALTPHKPTNTKILSDTRLAPVVRNDTETLKGIYTDVSKQLMAGESVYVVSSNFTFNVDIFRNIPLSLTGIPKSIPDSSLALATQLDVRDGFSKGFFEARLVIDSSPAGYITSNHSEQQIVKILHESMEPGGALRDYYTIIGVYALDKNHKVFVYRKVTEVPVEVRAELIDAITKTHPGSIRIH